MVGKVRKHCLILNLRWNWRMAVISSHTFQDECASISARLRSGGKVEAEMTLTILQRDESAFRLRDDRPQAW